jgi:hypothetical protein
MLIMVLAYGVVALVARSRHWVLAPTCRHVALFVAVGLSITVVIGWLAPSGRWVGRWTYAPDMPVVPGIAIGVAPLLQWFVLSLLTVWFVRRQLERRRGRDEHTG